MIERAFPKIAVSILLISPSAASSVSRQATLIGGGGDGKCTIEVTVDGAAEIDVFGGTGILRTVSGQQAEWRRFRCNAPLPRNPVDFRFSRRNGRGRTVLVTDPRSNGGGAVVRIDDPKGGRDVYVFDLSWRGADRHPNGWHPPLPGGRPEPAASPMQTAIRTCQDAVTNRLNRERYRGVTFERTVPDNRPGADDWINGSVTGRSPLETTRFGFSCSADFQTGIVHSVNVRRTDR